VGCCRTTEDMIGWPDDGGLWLFHLYERISREYWQLPLEAKVRDGGSHVHAQIVAVMDKDEETVSPPTPNGSFNTTQ
jgi:hypothetical protein